MSERAILYARTSSDDRSRDSLGGQLEMCQEYARDKGYTVIAEMAEDERGVSGADLNAPKLNEALELARDGQFDVLVTRELDRFSRRLAKQLVIEEEFKRHGVAVEYVLEAYDDTPEGRLQKHVKATVAEYEREKIKQRLVRGRRRKAKKGSVILHSRVTYGYIAVEDDERRWLEIHEPEARIVRLIFDWCISGDGENGPLTIYKIAEKLNALGVPTYAQARKKKWASGNGWMRGSVHRILTNPTYKGDWFYGKFGRSNGKRVVNPESHLIQVDVPAIVDETTWNAAQAQLARNRTNSGRGPKYEYLFRGHVVCGHCRTNATGCPAKYKDKVYLYYRCTAAHNYDYRQPCDAPRFRSDEIDAKIWEHLQEYLETPEKIWKGARERQADRERESAPLKDRLTIIEDLIGENEAQRERLVDLYLMGDFPKDVLTDRKVRLDATITSLKKERATLTATLETRTITDEQIRELEQYAAKVTHYVNLAGGDFEAKRRIIEMMDSEVVLTVEDGQKVARYYGMAGEKRFTVGTQNT